MIIDKLILKNIILLERKYLIFTTLFTGDDLKNLYKNNYRRTKIIFYSSSESDKIRFI